MNWKPKVAVALLAVGALSTVLPLPASKLNYLGYESHCGFAPWSTVILLAAGLSVYFYSGRERK